MENTTYQRNKILVETISVINFFSEVYSQYQLKGTEKVGPFERKIPLVKTSFKRLKKTSSVPLQNRVAD